MAFNLLEFTKDWNNPDGTPNSFPTVEDSEVQVRADLQLLHDETKAALNAIVNKLNSIVDGSSGADNIGATPLSGGVANTVQGIIEELAVAVALDAAARHTHTNKTLLDSYNQTNSDLSDAVSKKHSHSNKTTLDGISSDDVTAWDAIANMLEGISSVVTTLTGGGNTAIPTAGAVLAALSETGNGDMLKGTYDPTVGGVATPIAAAGGIIAYLVANYQAKLTFDATPTNGSSNPVTSDGVYDALALKQDTLTFDNSPTQNSSNPVKSGGVYTALGNKQDTLTFDNSPTQNSSNPVKSGGVYTALAGKVGASSGVLDAKLQANATAQATLGDSQVRDIIISTTDIGTGADLAAGKIYIYYS